MKAYGSAEASSTPNPGQDLHSVASIDLVLSEGSYRPNEGRRVGQIPGCDMGITHTTGLPSRSAVCGGAGARLEFGLKLSQSSRPDGETTRSQKDFMKLWHF